MSASLCCPGDDVVMRGPEGRGRLVKRFAVGSGKFEFDDARHAAFADIGRHADRQSFDPVFPVAAHGDRQQRLRIATMASTSAAVAAQEA